MPNLHGEPHLREELRGARAKPLVTVETELLGYSLAIGLFLLIVISLAKYFNPAG